MSGRGVGRCQGGTGENGTNKEVDILISSQAWLKIQGLKESKLCLHQVFAQIGFKHSEDYVRSLRKPVSSQYAEGMFSQFMKDGAVYNLTASPEQLQELCERLQRKARLYQRRLDWLTSGSRQLFGVVQEHAAALVLDFGRASGAQFQLSQDSVCLVIREQVSHIFRFNLIRSATRMKMWQEKAVPASDTHIDSAVEWVWKLKPEESPSAFDTAEAVLKAMEDSRLEAVYLFTVGDFRDSLTDVLKNRLLKNVCPIHIVSFNANKKETIQVLKELSQLTAGRFHVFAEMHTFKDELCDSGCSDGGNGHPTCLPAKPIGGVPPGAGVREDVFLIWREMEEAQTTRARLQAILMNISPPAPEQEAAVGEHAVMRWSEAYLSSRVWLTQYGLRAQKLLLFDALADCAFRHSDGVVDVRVKPGDESVQTDAVANHKLVNAKYCNRFVHMRWKDGSLAHVYVSADECRRYEERMKTALMNIQRRLEWLSRGSRELFGAVLEERVYILLDTSESMKDQLPLVKEKIQQLIKEQLRQKAQVNFVKFGSRVAAWRERLVEVSPQSLENAWSWVKGLQAGGSTNTLGALQLALADINTQAVYLLTDGRPDQPTGTILAQVEICPPVPVHTISFNCKDPEANHFLCQLALETAGRYHCFPCGPQEPGAPTPYMSEDTHLLKAEIEQGKKELERVMKLRAECVMLDWYHNRDSTTAKRTGERPHSAPWLHNVERPRRPRSALGCVTGPCPSHRPQIPTTQARSSPPRLARHAAQTKTSLLRLLSSGVGVGAGDSGGGALQEWMLPETLSLFQTNTDKQKQVLSRLEVTPLDVSQKKPKRKTPTESLSMSSAGWLRTNSLVARRLTIIDALAPTAITHSAKFIPVLEKHVYSKVFEEVFPLAHVSGCTGQLTLVNPQAVNLEHYKTRLQAALQDYQRRLDLIVWKALTQEERDKFGSDMTVRFQEHREALLRALEKLGWPLPPEDVSLLEDQISMALSFLQQASDLQQAAKQTSATRDIKRTGSPSSRAQGGTKPRRALDTLRGQNVLARSEADGFYYPGTVRKRLARKRVFVDLNSGETEIVPLRSLITVGGAGPCPTLRVGDFVLVGSGTEGTGDYFVPGVVIATPRRLEPSDKLHTILKYDSRKVHTLRSNMVKISQTRYDLNCRQLRERYGELQRLDHRRRTGSASQQKAADRKSSRTERRKTNRPREASGALHALRSPDTDHHKDEDPESRRDSSSDERDILGDKSRRSCSTPSSTSQTLTPLPSQTPTPCLGKDSLIAKGKELPAPHPADRMEALAHNLLLALEQHRGQQEEIQRYIKALFPHCPDEEGQEEQRELTTQQQEALEKLDKLIPPTAGQANQDQDKQGDPGGVPEYVNTARLLMPKVSPGREVLARWACDGWYYYSSVVHSCGDQSYFLQSREGALERVWREDIITEGEDSSQEIKAEDPVIGAHPLYPDRYCPGVVLTVTEDLQTKVRYYDGSEAVVSREQLFQIPAQKFERDVAYILEREESWVGELVVARRDDTETYHPAEVQQRVGNGRQYLIRWGDGTSAVQDREWIFGKWSRAQAVNVGDYALALADPASLCFLPGVVQGSTGMLLHIHFINGESQSVEPHHCFWLSQGQFNMAAHLVASQRWRRTQEEEEGEEEEEEVEEEGGDDTEDELDKTVYSTDSSTSNL